MAVEVGSDFSGVGALDEALKKLKINYKTVFACDMDLSARETYIDNHGEPKYFPLNVYDREIPKKSVGLYMTTPPCQTFSLAGKRLGESDQRGVLFYNSHEFIKVNNPRYFILENVKGLLSDNGGKTFSTWIDMLGGKSVNGNPVIFPREDSVPYHIYYKVLNAKHHGVPQNRERVFIVGIRDDSDNFFRWPKPKPLLLKLKDVLEPKVEGKYYLSKKIIKGFIKHKSRHEESKNGFGFKLSDINLPAKSVTTKSGSRNTDNYIKVIGNSNPSGKGMGGVIYSDEGISPTLTTNKGEGIKVNSALKSGLEIAKYGDSINLSQINSKTRRGWVGKEVVNTLDTACNQAVVIGKIRKLTPREYFRLMGFPDSFKLDKCSNTQLYKQAGNSIVVDVLAEIINKLNLK